MDDLQRAYAGMDGSEVPFEKLLRELPRVQKASNHPMAALHRMLVWSLVLTVLITAVVFVVLILVPETLLRISSGAILAFCIWATIDAFRLVRDWRGDVSPKNSLLEEMRRQHGSITEWMRLQMRVALFVYPFAIVGGFCWGGMVGSGKDLATFMEPLTVQVLLLVLVVLFVPVCYFTAKWLFTLWFGRHLAELGARIEELRS